MIQLILIVSVLLFNVCATYGQPSDCDQLPSALPTFSKFIKAKKKKFTSENGAVVEQKLSKQTLSSLCEGQTPKNTRLFNDKNMFPFVIDKSCTLVFAEQTKSGQFVPHTVLAAERDIIGGGHVQCLKQKSGEPHFYLSSKSSRYCFDFAHMKFAIEALSSSGVSKENIWLKPQNAKFCKQKKSRLSKYQDIISGKFKDFGYKKSHTYRADNYLKLFKNN